MLPLMFQKTFRKVSVSLCCEENIEQVSISSLQLQKELRVSWKLCVKICLITVY